MSSLRPRLDRGFRLCWDFLVANFAGEEAVLRTERGRAIVVGGRS